jgi:hypothetical protein
MSDSDLTLLSFVMIGFIIYVIAFIKQKKIRDEELLKKVDYLIILLERINKEK